MRICLISPFKTDPKPYLALCQKTFSLCRDDTEVIYKTTRRATDVIEDLKYPYTWFLTTGELVESILAAEREGYDAAVVSCFMDVGVKEARSAVQMPVIGVGEATMMYASLLGSRFGIVTGKIPFVVQRITQQIGELGLSSRAILNRPVRPHTLSERDMITAMQANDAKVLADGVEKVGRELIGDGADVVVCGVTAMSPACTAAGLSRLEPEGIPLLDCLGISLKLAELMVELKKKVGLPCVNRGPLYEWPGRENVERLRNLFGLVG